MSTKGDFRICGIYDENNTLLYLGKADRKCSQWAYGVKSRHSTKIGFYIHAHPEKQFHSKTLCYFKRSGSRDKAFYEYHEDLNPIFKNGFVRRP